MSDILWQPMLPAPWLAALATLAALVVFLRTRRLAGLYPPRTEVLLLLLRLLPLVFLLLLALRPSLETRAEEQRKAPLLVLLDASESMNVADMPERESRWRAVQQRLRETWWKPLSERYDVSAFTFSSFARPLDPSSDAPTDTVAGKSTDIGGALEHALGGLGGRAPAAVVLCSDGNHNVGTDPRAVPPVAPVLAVGLGTPSDYRDVEVVRLAAPQLPMVGEKIPIRVDVQAFGFPEVRTGLRLTVHGPLDLPAARNQDLDKPDRVLLLGEGQGASRQEFMFTAVDEGRYRVVAELLDLPQSDAVRGNNTREIEVQVRKKAIKILILSGSANYEQRFLFRHALASDPRFQVLSVIDQSRGIFMIQHNQGYDSAADETYIHKGTPLEVSFTPFDCIVLVDTPRDLLSHDNWRILARAVETEGKSLVIMGGERAFDASDGILGTPLGDVLPLVKGGRARKLEESPGQLVPTEDGKFHPLLTFIRDLAETASGQKVDLPLLRDAYELPGPDADAIVLAREEQGRRTPILIYQKFGKGHTLLLAMGQTWQWFFQTPEGDPLRVAYLSFWRNTVRWMTTHEINPENRRVQIFVDKDRITLGERFDIRVLVHGYEVLPDDLVLTGVLRSSEGLAEPWPMPRLTGETRELRLPFAPATTGAMELVVRAKRGGLVVDEARQDLFVEAQAAERLAVGINQPLLEELAQKTGGRYLAWSDADRLLELLPGRMDTEVQLSQAPLGSSWPVFLLLVAAWTLDWVVRRRLGLP